MDYVYLPVIVTPFRPDSFSVNFFQYFSHLLILLENNTGARARTVILVYVSGFGTLYPHSGNVLPAVPCQFQQLVTAHQISRNIAIVVIAVHLDLTPFERILIRHSSRNGFHGSIETRV